MKSCVKVVGTMLLAMVVFGCAKQDLTVSALVRTGEARPVVNPMKVSVDLAEIVKP